MTGSKELSKQQRPWLQIYNKIHLAYGRQALNSERKISLNAIIYFVWWKCHRDSPGEKTNAAPKDGESSESAKELPGSGTCQTVLGLQHPLKPQDGNTHPHSYSHFSGVIAARKTPEGLTHSSYLFPSLSWRQTWCNGPQKSNLVTKVLRDGNQIEIPPHLYPKEQRCDGLLFKSRKNGSAFCLLPTSNHFFFSCQI